MFTQTHLNIVKIHFIELIMNILKNKRGTIKTDLLYFAQMMEDDDGSSGPIILRQKRAAGKEKNTCQLFIQTDHFFYKYYGSQEAVIAQVCKER